MQDLDRSRRERKVGATSSATRKLLDACTLDGKVYCVPVNIHSWQWLWLSDQAYKDAGVPGADELGRIRRGRSGAPEGRQDSAGDG